MKRPVVWAYADVVCDLFHPGHLALFRQCRRLADRLIVGVHSDEDVAKYKRRPVMTLDERVAMVRTCTLVDRVIPAAPLQTTAAFLDTIGAAFVCHGDDINTAKQAEYYGDLVTQGRVRLVRYTKTISTTQLLSRLHERLPTEYLDECSAGLQRPADGLPDASRIKAT